MKAIPKVLSIKWPYMPLKSIAQILLKLNDP